MKTDNSKHNSPPRSGQVERFLAYGFGVVFVTTMLVVAILFPNPSNFQHLVFRVILALAAAGVAAFIPGLIRLNLNDVVRAGGAIAIFVAVYFLSPANLVSTPEKPTLGISMSEPRVMDDVELQFIGIANPSRETATGISMEIWAPLSSEIGFIGAPRGAKIESEAKIANLGAGVKLEKSYVVVDRLTSRDYFLIFVRSDIETLSKINKAVSSIGGRYPLLQNVTFDQGTALAGAYVGNFNFDQVTPSPDGGE